MTTTTAETNQYSWVRQLLPPIVIGALIAAALVGVYAVIIGEFNDLCWRLIGTIALFVFFSLVSWYDADVSARRAPWFGAVSVVASVYLLLVGLTKVWVPADIYGPFWQQWSWFGLVFVTRIGLLHMHLVLNTQRRFTGPIMSKVTIVTLTLVGALTTGLSLPLLFPNADFGETYWRSIAVIAILDALGTILIPLTYQLFGPKKHPTDLPQWQAPTPFPHVPESTAVPPIAMQAAPAAATQVALPRVHAAYPNVHQTGGLRLEWPRYINGTPVPAREDGSPDFMGVVGC
ncbi:MAG: hypothetical protein ABI067_17110 [Leifsonia sp.]